MTITYPTSRANITSCHLCNRQGGQLRRDGHLRVICDDESVHLLMKFICTRCGHTFFFEPDVAKSFPYDGRDEEEEFVE